MVSLWPPGSASARTFATGKRMCLKLRPGARYINFVSQNVAKWAAAVHCSLLAFNMVATWILGIGGR